MHELTRYIERERAGGRYRVYRVAVCSSGTSASYFFPPFLKMARDDYETDFYISVTRLGCDDAFEGDEIITVEREGAILSVVKDPGACARNIRKRCRWPAKPTTASIPARSTRRRRRSVKAGEPAASAFLSRSATLQQC